MKGFQHDYSERIATVYPRQRSLARVALAVIAMSGLGIMGVPSPAIAANDSQGDFRRCASTLLRLQLSEEEAVNACARNINPQDLSRCVEVVSRDGYAAADALNACRQVRRPRDMAYCVSDIRKSLKDAVATEVLDNCRRSLLPDRYSNCVIGNSQGASGLAPATALVACNDAQYFPREVDPTFIPYSANQPSLLIPETSQPQTPLAPEVQPAPVSPTPAPASPVRGLY